MVDGIVTHHVTYRGTDLVTLSSGQLRLCFRLTRGLYGGEDVRGVDVTVPGLAGRISANRLYDRRMLEVEGFVQGVGASEAARLADFETAMSAVMALFDPKLAAGSLVVGLQGGGSKTISARTLPETVEGEDRIPGRLDLGFRLEAIGADWA